MSREPQTYLAQRFDPDALGQPALALQLEARHNDTEVPVHRHRKGQLVVACRGGITCTVPDGLWMVPAGFGVWIPGGIAHSNRSPPTARSASSSSSRGRHACRATAAPWPCRRWSSN